MLNSVIELWRYPSAQACHNARAAARKVRLRQHAAHCRLHAPLAALSAQPVAALCYARPHAVAAALPRNPGGWNILPRKLQGIITVKA